MREFVQLRPIPGSSRYGGPGGQLQRRARDRSARTDHRRGQILPRNAPPEILGALAIDGPTRGVRGSAAARCRWGPSDDRVRMFERWVPPIQAWLAEHPSADGGTARRAGGAADASSAIAELVERAATGARPRIDATLPPAQTESIAGAVEASVETPPIAPEADGPEFLDGVDAADAGRPRRFIEWVQQGIADGTCR